MLFLQKIKIIFKLYNLKMMLNLNKLLINKYKTLINKMKYKIK